MILITSAGVGAYSDVVITTDALSARFHRSALVGLRDDAGVVMVEEAAVVRGGGILRVGAEHWVEASVAAHPFSFESGALEQCTALAGLPGGELSVRYEVDAATGDILINQRAVSPEGGVSAVRWSIERIPLDWRVIVPGRSGLRLTADTPGDSFTFDYPMSWEAQLLIVEGDKGGFYVWADDAEGHFKRLVVERDDVGWRIGFDTHPLAPYEDKTTCASVTWRLNGYKGDWRVPARRYRDWMEQHFGPTRIEKQQPEWVKDIGACVIMSMDSALLASLARELDPAKTMIYIYDWRSDGYDRNYPDYDAVYDAFPPFMEKAKAMGFRVMLHVNYFGCDPEHPLYETVAPYHCRVPHGQNDKDWWHYPAVEPPIKFAYINPASNRWRREIVERFTRLCETYDVDALHLDQTLVIYNDYNGLIDGMTMIEGNIALHRELREALPNVALSGEGLNEISYRHEAFAQLHVHGIDHAENAFNMAILDMAHPINAYLFRPYTVSYGYLGVVPPTQTRLHAAWLEAYRRWGVIPTLKPASLASIEAPTAFTRSLFDEMRVWMNNGLVPDMEGPWPPDIAFPLRTASGKSAAYTRDGALVLDGREVQRIISGARTIELPGKIPGWRGYTDTHLIGLDPDDCYPYVPEPRDPGALRITSLPEGYTIKGVYESEALAYVRTAPVTGADIRLATLLDDAMCGSRPVNGVAYEQQGPLMGPDGAQFIEQGDALYAHPPWRDPGSGEAYARFELQLPDTARVFTAHVAINPFAVGEPGSDGVTFGVSLRSDAGHAHQEVFTDRARRTPIEMDVKAFAGQKAVLELIVGPGPAGNPSFDWARWFNPRIVCDVVRQDTLSLAGLAGWSLALSSDAAETIASGQPTATMAARFPGAVYLLAETPEAVSLPVLLTDRTFEVAYHLQGRITAEAPQHACARAETNTVGGMARPGFFAHPPDHGATVMHFPLLLGEESAKFHSYIGLRDGAEESSGVIFRIEVNGAPVAEQAVMPGNWYELEVDLSGWAGQVVVLALVTDADGDYICDWACWGTPRLVRDAP